jgi:putative multiple sugar transport system permease protein
MSTETAPPVVNAAKASMQGAMKENLREYGLVLALVIIMVFFQVMTNGILFKPVNLTNLVLQNSYIIVMALGMLLVIVAGHIDLSVGSVAGFIGAVAALLMVDFGVNPLLAGLLCICLIVGGAIGACRAISSPTPKIPSFIVTLGRHAGVQGPVAQRSERPFGRPVSAGVPAAQRRLHSRLSRAGDP